MTAQILFSQAVQLHQTGNLPEAERLYLEILSREPQSFDARHMLGLLRSQQGRNEEALELIGGALKTNPGAAGALSNYGNVLKNLSRFGEALENYDKALAANPRHAMALNNRGVVLWELKRFDEALASYDRALAIKPGYAEALANKGLVLADQGRLEDALAFYDQALVLEPQHAEALYNRGTVLWRLGRSEDALFSYEKALIAAPDHPYALDAIAYSALWVCDWQRAGRYAGRIRAGAVSGNPVIAPFTLLGYYDDAALQLKSAQNYIQNKLPLRHQSLWDGKPYRHGRIRIAYLSMDFRNHPVGYFIAHLIRRHDRRHFEIIAISFGPDDGSAIRAQLMESFDQFHDVRLADNRDAAALLRRLEVDIAVDLSGYTQDARPEIFSYRPCPVQVNYLGYPGTLGADFMDYIIADKVVAPLEDQAFFAEKIVHLPDCYLVNGSRLDLTAKMPTRADAGLPERGFVFCCFNSNWKIIPPFFDVWMLLLNAVPGSVLWLLKDSDMATNNLNREARARGVDPARLIFAPRAPLAAHLSRHRLADLFLDTLPYNAHTTASDALWVGVPLVTVKGKSFAARVAASILQAAGLPELVTENLGDYEALCLKLARDPALLKSIRQKLENNRLTMPPFDGDALRRNIEAIYTRLREQSEARG